MKVKFISSMRNISIKYKLIAVFIIIVLIPFFLLSVFYAYYIQNILKERVIANHKETTRQVGQNVNIILRDMTTTASLILANNDIQEVLSNNIYDDPVNIFRNKNIISNFFLDIQYSVLSYPNSFTAIKDKYANIHISQVYLEDDLRAKVNDFLNKNLENGESLAVKWIGTVENTFIAKSSARYYVIMIRQIPYGSDKSDGQIMICVDEKNFHNALVSGGTDPNVRISIVDENKRVIASTDIESTGKIFRKNIKLEANDEFSGFFDDSENREVINTFRLSNGKWHVVEVIPYSMIYKDIANTRILFLTVGSVILILFIAVSVVMVSKISKPIINLTKVMKDVQNGDLNVRVTAYGNDEVGQLSEAFNKMIKRINELIVRINEEQKKKRDAELKMLRAQIKPHFLFNTLNSIRWVAEMSQAKYVSELIVALSSLMKNSILNNKEFITLEEEIQNLKNYCKIQESRYGGIFDINFDMEDKALQCKVLNLILQPIIENSLIHGFEGMTQNGIIHIKAGIEQNNLIIEVKDNGKGMSAEDINDLLNGSSEAKDGISGIGILNVNERIRMNFGDDYGLKMYGEKGKGVTTVISFPVDFAEGSV